MKDFTKKVQKILFFEIINFEIINEGSSCLLGVRDVVRGVA